MGGTLKFNLSEVEAVLASSEKEVGLVGDHGIYFCSDTFVEGQGRTCAYGLGVNPKLDDFESWWEKKRRIFGGDDGVDYFPKGEIQEVVDNAKANNAKFITVKFTAKSLEFSYSK